MEPFGEVFGPQGTRLVRVDVGGHVCQSIAVYIGHELSVIDGVSPSEFSLKRALNCVGSDPATGVLRDV